MCSAFYRLGKVELTCSWPAVLFCNICRIGLCQDHAFMCDECDSILCMNCEPGHRLAEEMEELLKNGNLQAGGEA